MLELGRIPLRSRDRAEDDPLVIAGGPTATHPEPISAFIDAIVVGDGEERTTEVALLWTELRDAGVPRAERPRAPRRAPRGVRPALVFHAARRKLFARVRRAVARSARAAPGAPLARRRSQRVPLPRRQPGRRPRGDLRPHVDRDRARLHRGLPILPSGDDLPPGPRARPRRDRRHASSARSQNRGYDEEASLTSLSSRRPLRASRRSSRRSTEKLSARKGLARSLVAARVRPRRRRAFDDLQRVRASGITFAPEAGSQRMRDVVNKNVTEEQLMTTAERVFSRGWTKMKLYFMIGLPTEEESDVREIVRVGGRAREVGKRIKRDMNAGRRAQGHGQRVDARAEAAYAVSVVCDGHLERGPEKAGVARSRSARTAQVDLRMHGSEGSWLEEHLRPRRPPLVSDVLEHAFKNGARFDSWEDQLQIDVWERALAACGVDPAPYLGTIPTSARLPWDHIDVGLEEGFLAREYRKALKSRLSPPCGKVARRVRAPDEPPRRRRRCPQARLLRLRRRVRSHGDARRAPRQSAQARRGRAARALAQAGGRRGDQAREEGRAKAAAADRARRGAAATDSRTPRSARSAFLSHPRRRSARSARVPPRRDADLLLVGLPPQARHDVRPGALARRREPRRSRRREARERRRRRRHRARARRRRPPRGSRSWTACASATKRSGAQSLRRRRTLRDRRAAQGDRERRVARRAGRARPRSSRAPGSFAASTASAQRSTSARSSGRSPWTTPVLATRSSRPAWWAISLRSRSTSTSSPPARSRSAKCAKRSAAPSFPFRAVRIRLGAWRGADLLTPLDLAAIRDRKSRDLIPSAHAP